jgi:hypothetical protein
MVTNDMLTPSKLAVSVPEHLIDVAVRIPVDTAEIVGEIVLYRESDEQHAEAKLASAVRIETVSRTEDDQPLLRGGFRVGNVPSLPHVLLSHACDAQIELKARGGRSKVLPGTDLARGAVDGEQDIGSAVFQQWFEFILKNIEEFERRPPGDYELRERAFSGTRWLENYSALEVFRAAKVFWKCALGSQSEFDLRMADWENSKGPHVVLGQSYSFHRFLLALVLPRVCSMVALERGRQGILPPKANWKSELSACKTFVTKRIPWPLFVVFAPEIADVLIDLYPGMDYFNIKYKSRFAAFETEELSMLPAILDIAKNAQKWKRRARLSASRADLLRRTVEVAGDLSISHLGTRILIGDLA